MKKIGFVTALTVMITMLNCFIFFKGQTNALKDFRGVWVCSVNNLDFPSTTGLDSEALKKEIDDIIETCKAKELNAVFFQVRPNADSLYRSDIFPWSKVLSGTQGNSPDSGFDPLSYIIKKAHENSIELHAWINPYRIGKGEPENIFESLTADHPAKLHPEYVVTCSDGGVYFNPALSEVRQLIIDGVSEIVANYEVDGIHFDDYFYPYGVTDYPDSVDFKKYGSEFTDIADFRRNNVNLLIKETYEKVHSIKSNVRFGVSPFGIWDNKNTNPLGSDTTGMSSYSAIYADSRTWVKNGWVDYICPQVYWSFETPAAPFDKVASWWNDLCAQTGTDLYIGHAMYKIGTQEEGWQDPEQMTRQIKYTDSLSAVTGNVYFRYGTLDAKAQQTEYIKTDPITSNTVKITSPQNGYSAPDKTCSITGIADPSKSLTVNGDPVTMTEHGYFSAFVNLSIGKNTFTFKNGSSSASITIIRTEAENKTKVFNTCFKQDSAYPFCDTKLYSDEYVKLEVEALPECQVYALYNGEELELEKGETKDGFANFYCGVNMPTALNGDIDLGNVTFRAAYNGEEYIYDAATLSVLSHPITLYTVNEAYVYDSVFGGSMMDNYQLPAGCELTATAKVGENYRLVSGMWISAENVSLNKTECPVASADVDKTKYIKTELKFSFLPTFQCNVTESGVLSIDIYGEIPEISGGDALDISIIKKGVGCTAVFKKDKPITGFYVTPSDNTLTVLIYEPASGIEGKTVVLDVGHGGTDKGAYGPAGADGACENDLNLSMSYAIKQKLEAAGAVVYLTRTDDATLLLAERAALIRSYNPDISISVHHNATTRYADFNKANGTLVLYSRETAYPVSKIIKNYISNGLPTDNEGFRTQSLNVCRDYRYPCVLLECGYVCNPAEYEHLLTDEYKNTLAQNVTQALCDYFA